MINCIKFFAVAILMTLSISLSASVTVELKEYLPNAANYDPSVPTPESSLGFQVGDWHARPEQIHQYFNLLADKSVRVKLEITGYTHEKRPLMLAYISSAENINNLESIRQTHLNNQDTAETPIISWMGYSVHGNEASGSNASMLFAYHLAAANDAKTLAQLKNQIIIVDPMLNPDGLARFASWVNTYRSAIPNPDPNDIEHNENWPGGRTNHYWFDLNRDWLLLQHPESKARVAQFHRWRPHILTDFHEMGTDGSYFFQPGVHSRQNPLTPEDNFKMTATIAQHHAKALDGIGSLYYSKEDFDDFYYGKGSTYPDVHGTVGILFEQASARGHTQQSAHGGVTFPFAIKNHLTTSFSSIEAAQANSAELKLMQRNFVTETKKLAKSDKYKAIVFASSDEYRLREMLAILQGHQIAFYPLKEALKVEKQAFKPDHAYIVPLKQAQYRLIKSMFEARKEFKDKIFYDVSAWNFGMAFDLDFAWVDSSDFDSSLLGKSQPEDVKTLNILPETLLLGFDWSNFVSTRLLSEMLQWELRVQTITRPTQVKTSRGETKMALGSLILPLSNQVHSREAIIQWLQPRLARLQLEPVQISSGLAISGIDLGSPSMPVLSPVRPLLVIGEGVSSYDAGEVWHLLDQRLSQPVSMMTISQIEDLPTLEYSHLILVNGVFAFNDKTQAKIEAWVKNGGTIIAHSGGAKWLFKQEWMSSEIKTFNKPKDTRTAYSEKSQTDAEQRVGGAIVHASIDVSHPLAFGLANQSIAIFKRGEQVFTEPKEAFVAISRFSDKPHAAGYLSKAVIKHIANESSILVQSLGKGKLIAFSDDPLFRGYWLGLARVFSNALYFSSIIEAPVKTKEETPKNAEVKK